jgi:hypothetical protein
MKTETAKDIWTAGTKTDGLVVPFSICWRSDGRCVMGRGIAAQANRRIPYLARDLGALCQRAKDHTPLTIRRSKKWGSHIFLLPIRSVNWTQPYAGWRDPINTQLIITRLAAFMKYLAASEGTPQMPEGNILIPSLSDELETSQAEHYAALMHQYLTHPKCILIIPTLRK